MTPIAAAKRKIVFVISDLGPGGAQKALTGIINEWAKRDYKITLIIFDDKHSIFFPISDRVKIIRLGLITPSTGFYSSLKNNFKRIRSLRAQIKEEFRDKENDTEASNKVVISFIAPTNVITILSTWLLGITCIVSERNDPTRQSFGRLWDVARRWLYPQASYVVANSRVAFNALAVYMPTQKLDYIPNHIDLPQLSLDSDSRSPRSALPQILTVGRLHPQKDYPTALKAFSLIADQFPSWTYHIVGEGEQGPALLALCESLGISKRIIFHGRTDRVNEIYARSKIFVLPSLHEGTPNALLEALSWNLQPIVSDAIDGAKDLSLPETHFFRQGDAIELAEKISDCIKKIEFYSPNNTHFRQYVENRSIQEVIKMWDRYLV